MNEKASKRTSSRSCSRSRSRSPPPNCKRNPRTDRRSSPLANLIQEQRSCCAKGSRPTSPIYSIPLEYCVGDHPKHITDWIKRQENKSKSSNIDESFYNHAKDLINNGKAEELVKGGFNVFGSKLRRGHNFFDKPLGEDYGMYDCLPNWVKGSKSGNYTPTKKSKDSKSENYTPTKKSK